LKDIIKLRPNECVKVAKRGIEEQAEERGFKNR
jgi:hypothetical protein